MKNIFRKKLKDNAIDVDVLEKRINQMFEREKKLREEFATGLMVEHRRYLEETFTRERIFREEFSHGLAKEMRYYNNKALRHIIPHFYDRDGKIFVHNNDEQRLMLDARETFMTLHVLENGEWETQVRAAMALILSPGDTYIDIGANVGLHTLYGAKLVGEKGYVIAVEPHPRTYAYLEENIKINGMGNYVTTLCKAVSDVADQDVPFQYFPQHPGMSSFKLLQDHIDLFGATPETVTVKTTTLDSLLAPNYKADLIKIDVEGFELQVIEGGKKFFDNNKDACFLIEYQAGVVHAQLGPDACKKFEGFFQSRGYIPYSVTHDKGLVKGTYEEFDYWTSIDTLFVHPKSRHYVKISK